MASMTYSWANTGYPRVLFNRKGPTSTTRPILPTEQEPSNYIGTPEYTPASIRSAPGMGPVNYQNMPGYSAPAWNEREIESLTQKRAASGLRELRRQVQRVMGRSYGNPQATRMTLRDALQGYGAGIDRVMSGASATAASEYASKYGRQSENAWKSYQASAAATSDYNRRQEMEAERDYSGRMSQWQAQTAEDTAASRMNWQSKADEARTRFDNAWKKWYSQFGTEQSGTTPVYGYSATDPQEMRPTFI